MTHSHVDPPYSEDGNGKGDVNDRLSKFDDEIDRFERLVNNQLDGMRGELKEIGATASANGESLTTKSLSDAIKRGLTGFAREHGRVPPRPLTPEGLGLDPAEWQAPVEWSNDRDRRRALLKAAAGKPYTGQVCTPSGKWCDGEEVRNRMKRGGKREAAGPAVAGVG